MSAKTVLPAVAMTAVSMVLTLAVVVMWLGTAMPWPVALVVGLGIDGGWLATLAYERRLAAQGDHSRSVTAVGWSFGLIATGVLITHALTANHAVGAWLAVAWLPIAAKALWLVHGLWERTALTPSALDAIRSIQQDARDKAAVSRAQLRAGAVTEETRLAAVTAAGARVARVQAKTAGKLAGAWSELEGARQGKGTGKALTSVATGWDLPAWGAVPVGETPAPALASTDSANAEESTESSRERSTADQPESTPVTVTLTRLPVPDPLPCDLGKSDTAVKSIPRVAPAIEPVPIETTPARSIPAESTRPRRATGRVPASAKSTRTRRTPEQLLTEARKATAGWTTGQITAEAIRRKLHTSPANARMLRDTILAERSTGVGVTA
ncbi:hypothetical protein [Streptomyces sp. HYC2]|uniref:hypothetical protein n=1 Tax=Streptomyces sp. HYC2 TaxID=2955207 RepID=UPI00247FFA6B|nr:hypothetical protein [Streptomyces sp. HYC2]